MMQMVKTNVVFSVFFVGHRYFFEKWNLNASIEYKMECKINTKKTSFKNHNNSNYSDISDIGNNN